MIFRRVRVVEVSLPGPPGLEAVFLSDIHARRRARLAEIGRLLEEIPADLLLLGGDYVERFDLLDGLADALGRGAFPLGRFAVRGNNDRRGAGAIRAALRRAGAVVLENTSVLVWHDGRALAVAGVLDPHRDRPDVAAALRGVPDDVPVILLAHSPDVVRCFPAGRPMTILAGHCHGGQIGVPGLLPLWTHSRAGRRMAVGRHRVGSAELFVGRGIGCSLVPVRTVPPEVYFIRFGV